MSTGTWGGTAEHPHCIVHDSESPSPHIQLLNSTQRCQKPSRAQEVLLDVICLLLGMYTRPHRARLLNGHGPNITLRSQLRNRGLQVPCCNIGNPDLTTMVRGTSPTALAALMSANVANTSPVAGIGIRLRFAFRARPRSSRSTSSVTVCGFVLPRL